MADINFYAIFNQKIVEFFQDIYRLFPDMKEFEFYANIVKTTSLIDEKTPMQFFKSTVEIPFGEKLKNKDENFILEQNFEEVDNQSLINVLKKIWTGLDEQNKETVWKYVHLFLALSKKV